MTLSQIMSEALVELDEDPSDLSEYEQRFKRYANDGYQIILRDYVKPRERTQVVTSKIGMADISTIDMVRLINVFDASGMDIPFAVSAEGTEIMTKVKNRSVTVLYERKIPPMQKELDEPQIPDMAHSALVDYVCYRHLSSGNLAKQSRAQYYLRNFYDIIGRLRPQAGDSTRNWRNLYEST